MGNLFGNKAEKKVVLLGLQNAGQSTVSYVLYPPSPYIGGIGNPCNVLTWNYKHLSFTSWDMSIEYTKARLLFRHYYNCVDAIVFFVKSDIDQAHDALHRVLNDLGPKFRHVPILLFCNETKMEIEEIRQRMGFFRYCEDSKLSDAELNDIIKSNSLLQCLPMDIFDIIFEYALKAENGLSLKRRAQQFMNMNFELIDKYFADDFTWRWLYKYSDRSVEIINVICSYLPRYQYNDLPSTQYGIMSGSDENKEDVLKAMRWLVHALKKTT